MPHRPLQHLSFHLASLCLFSLNSLPARFQPILLPATAAAPVHQDLLTHSHVLLGSLPLPRALVRTCSPALALQSRHDLSTPDPETNPTVCVRVQKRDVVGVLLARPGGNHVPRICYTPHSRALPLSYFFYTVSSAASTPFLPDVVVALLILIGTKITSIFPFSTVFCT